MLLSPCSTREYGGLEGCASQPLVHGPLEIRRNRMLKLGMAVILPFALFAAVPGWLAPHAADLTLAQPLQPPSGQFLLGTDEIGRDLLSRIIYASRVDLGVSVSSTVLAAIVGSTIGLFAGYRGHLWDAAVMRSTDVLLAFPSILLAIFMLTMFGRNELVLIVALAILFTPGFVRLARTLAVGIRERAFVSSSEIPVAGPLTSYGTTSCRTHPAHCSSAPP